VNFFLGLIFNRRRSNLISRIWIFQCFLSFLGIVVFCYFPNPAVPFASSGSEVVGILLLDLLAMEYMCCIHYVVCVEPLTPDFGRTIPASLKYI
jgi:hypothetical protein